jgi:hypothetical protein
MTPTECAIIEASRAYRDATAKVEAYRATTGHYTPTLHELLKARDKAERDLLWAALAGNGRRHHLV